MKLKRGIVPVSATAKRLTKYKTLASSATEANAIPHFHNSRVYISDLHSQCAYSAPVHQSTRATLRCNGHGLSTFPAAGNVYWERQDGFVAPVLRYAGGGGGAGRDFCVYPPQAPGTHGRRRTRVTLTCIVTSQARGPQPARARTDCMVVYHSAV